MDDDGLVNNMKNEGNGIEILANRNYVIHEQYVYSFCVVHATIFRMNECRHAANLAIEWRIIDISYIFMYLYTCTRVAAR